MYLGTLDHVCPLTDNQPMSRMVTVHARPIGCVLAVAGLLLLTSCAGISSASKQQPPNSPTGQLSVSPSTMSFGNVAVGSSISQTGTLTASQADVTVSSAGWNGDGYSVSGVTFPVTVPNGQSVKYSVTFAPASAGSASGSISFVSDASDSPLTEAFSGTGSQASSHSVALTWNASTSTVAGYNIYRGVQSGGPYSKLNGTLLTDTSYSDNGVANGATYYYVATAVDSNSVESAHSNQAVATIPNQ